MKFASPAQMQAYQLKAFKEDGIPLPPGHPALKKGGPALDAEFLAKVEGPIAATWSQLAYDASQLEGRQTNSGNMELVLDADRMSIYGGPNGKAADALVGEAIKEHGYDKVSKFLCRRIKL